MCCRLEFSEFKALCNAADFQLSDEESKKAVQLLDKRSSGYVEVRQNTTHAAVSDSLQSSNARHTWLSLMSRLPSLTACNLGVILAVSARRLK